MPFAKYSSDSVIEGLILKGQRPVTIPLESPTGVPYEPLWSLAKECWNSSPEKRPTMPSIDDRLHDRAVQPKPKAKGRSWRASSST